MWVFLSARFRRWMRLTVLVPVASAMARGASRRLERRSGSTRLTRALGSAGSVLDRRNRRRR